MNTLFTPGPWTADKDHFIRAAKGKINVAFDCRMALGTNVASVCGDHISKRRNSSLPVEPQITANARLIAAAPDMFLVLNGALSHDDACKTQYKMSPSLRREIEKALAKAGGAS